MSFKRCDLILVKNTNIVSRLIEEIQNSPYSHVAGIVKENEIVEAQGFQKTGYEGLDEYKGLADVYTCDILTDEQRIKIINYVEKEVNSHYNWLLLFYEFLRYVFNITIQKEFHSHICSTLWADAYKSAGIILCPEIKYPSPRDISESKLLRKLEKGV